MKNRFLGFNISSFVADVDILNNQKITVIWISLKAKTRRHYSVKEKEKRISFQKKFKETAFQLNEKCLFYCHYPYIKKYFGTL